MVWSRLWRVLTLEVLRKSSSSKSSSTRSTFTKFNNMDNDDDDHHHHEGYINDDKDNDNNEITTATSAAKDYSDDHEEGDDDDNDDDTPLSAGNKRNRSEGDKKPPPRQSLFRVNSRGDPVGGLLDNEVPNSPRARASTYTHVHDAVMYNLSEAERSKHDKSVPMGVIGLRNLGNTCFINSSLQCLSATIPLTDYFLGYDYRSEINKDNFLGTGGKLVVAYAELMKQMWLGSKSVVDPSSFKEQISTFAPQFSGYHQHDSQELLSYLLDGIHEDLNRVKTSPYVEDKDCDGTSDEQDAIEAWKNYLKRNKSLVVDLFQGQLRNTCKCLVCGHMNIRFEPFMYLSLPISDKAYSLDDCMDLYLNEETLSGEDQWYCEKCKQHVDATKKSDLWILPPILIVHLKRFKYNEHGKVGSKNDQSISYPVNQWDLKRYVKSTRGIYPVYDLYAVSNHMGGLGGGHYTATTLNRFDDLWYEFNDSHYKTVAESMHQFQTKSAYVLFYNRSEGDSSVPLNDRSPLIRRQSVSRPDLWPHTQMDDRNLVRNFTRSSRRFHENLLPSPLEDSKRRPGTKSGSKKQAHRTPSSNSQGTGTNARPGGPRLKRPPSNSKKSSSYQTRSKTRSTKRSNSPNDRKRRSDDTSKVKPDTAAGDNPRRTKSLPNKNS